MARFGRPMTIQDRLTDAKLLFDAKRYDGALLNVLLAVAAASRVHYPKAPHAPKGPRRPKTRKTPGGTGALGDGAAFRKFLAPRLAGALNFFDPPTDKDGVEVGVTITVRPEKVDEPLQDII